MSPNDSIAASVGIALLRDRLETRPRCKQSDMPSLGLFWSLPCLSLPNLPCYLPETEGEPKESWGEGEKGHFGVVILLLMDYKYDPC